MAVNFAITISKNSDGFEFILDGDFDITSAYELIYAIKKLPEETAKVYVNTNCLKEIHSSGLDVLNGFMNSLNAQSMQIIMIGHNSAKLSLKNLLYTSKISNFFLKELRYANV